MAAEGQPAPPKAPLLPPPSSIADTEERRCIGGRPGLPPACALALLTSPEAPAPRAT